MKWALDAFAFAPGFDTSLPTGPATAVMIRPVDSPTEPMPHPAPAFDFTRRLAAIVRGATAYVNGQQLPTT